MSQPIDIVYREDGQLVLYHLLTEEDTLWCGQPRYSGPQVTADNPPACPECFHKAKDDVIERYETIRQWEAWYDEHYSTRTPQ